MIEQLICWIGQMSDDEIRVLHRIAQKLMGEGRREYGALDLSTDKRTARHFRAEKCDEMADALVYQVLEVLADEHEAEHEEA